jgi:hypothetical protein
VAITGRRHDLQVERGADGIGQDEIAVFSDSEMRFQIGFGQIGEAAAAGVLLPVTERRS